MTTGHLLLIIGIVLLAIALLAGIPASLLTWKKHRKVLRDIRSSYQD